MSFNKRSTDFANGTVNVTVRRTVPVLPLLGLIFIILKVTGNITWSWWLVTMPLWGMVALPIAIVVLWMIIAAAVLGAAGLGVWVYSLFQSRKKKR